MTYILYFTLILKNLRLSTLSNFQASKFRVRKTLSGVSMVVFVLFLKRKARGIEKIEKFQIKKVDTRFTLQITKLEVTKNF